MDVGETLYLADREGWRRWLQKNHNKRKEIWLIFYKKHTGKPSISYNDSVEEALCFGWIDGQIKSVDDERYAGRYTPRKKESNWSKSNVQRALRMIRMGKMTPSGFAVLPKGLGKSQRA